MNLLVIDWDYFFPEEGLESESPNWMFYDWGHSEASRIYYGPLWVGRAAAFEYVGIPRPMTSGEEVGFWSRFTIARTATLFYAESNVAAFDRRIYRGAKVKTLWLYDAHHDGGYRYSLEEILKAGKVSCEDWTVAYHVIQKTAIHVRYPTWKSWAVQEPEPVVPMDRRIDDGESPPVRFDQVFVCRSGAWTPPWIDKAFFQFLQAAPVQKRVPLDLQPLSVRPWNEEWVQKDLTIRRELQQQIQGSHHGMAERG